MGWLEGGWEQPYAPASTRGHCSLDPRAPRGVHEAQPDRLLQAARLQHYRAASKEALEDLVRHLALRLDEEREQPRGKGMPHAFIRELDSASTSRARSRASGPASDAPNMASSCQASAGAAGGGGRRDTRLLAKRRRRSQSHPRLQPMLRLGLKLRLALRPPRLRRTRLGLKRRLALRPPRLRPMLQLRPRLGLKLPLALRPPRLRRTLLRWQRCPAARLRRAMRTSGPCQIAAGAARWSSQCRTRSFVVAPRGAAGRRRGRGLRRRPLRRPSRSRGRLAQATASSGAAAKIAWASASSGGQRLPSLRAHAVPGFCCPVRRPWPSSSKVLKHLNQSGHGCRARVRVTNAGGNSCKKTRARIDAKRVAG